MKDLIIGITGSREGFTETQKEAFLSLLSQYEVVEVHHGDCVGVDEGIHQTLLDGKKETPKIIRIHIHPPTDLKQRAFCQKKYETKDVLVHSYATEEYLKRNQAIVMATNELWAFPSGPEKQRSGTWATIRFARKTGKPVKLFWPDGRVE
ncbi:hypothetical protein [Leptospira levettii]|uniref:hypothetical protein n=1 Tax=Leptospira levettii TaxID=2023178 RepID=UPI003EB85257